MRQCANPECNRIPDEGFQRCAMHIPHGWWRAAATPQSATAEGANAQQVGGTHYKSSMECWDYIAANNIGYFEGTAIKYLTRWRKKGGVEDLRKAQHFIQKLIELES